MDTIVKDTIYPGQKFSAYACESGSYKNYGDTLIKHWFKTLLITNSSKKITKDPYNSNNWEWPKGLKENGPKKHEIDFTFTFSIHESDFK